MKSLSLAQLSTTVLLSAGLMLATSSAADMERVSAPADAQVYFISPQDGATVDSPIRVRMGLRGMGVAPAGVDLENTGHHHLLVNTPLDAVDLSASLPSTDHTLHFGGGQTEGEIELEPGTHSLQLLFMDHRHMSFDPPVISEQIRITVE